MSRRRLRIMFIIMMLTIGFAVVSATLEFNGLVGIFTNQDDFQIIFTSARLNNKKRNDFIDSTKKVINFETNVLTNVNEESILDYEVTNTSRMYDGEVVINCIAENNEYVLVNYAPKSMRVEAGSTKSGRIGVSLIKIIAEEKDINITCNITASALERETVGDEYEQPFSKSGVLMSTPADNTEDKKYWAYKSNITNVTFEDKMIAHSTEDNLIFDVSSTQDGSVMAYLVPNEETLITNKDADNKDLENTTSYDLYLQSDTGVVANPNCSKLFKDFNNLKSINNMRYFDTSLATDMSFMFYRNVSLESIDVRYFDTTNVTNMSNMFAQAPYYYNHPETVALNEIIGLENFDTSNVTNMEAMFRCQKNITSFNLSEFNTSKVKNMSYMFEKCTELKVQDLESLDVSNVENVTGMFHSCSSLNELKTSSWNLNSVNLTHSMFFECTNLQSLDVSAWNLLNLKDATNMFYKCQSLYYLNVSKWDLGSIESMYGTFLGCLNLNNLNASNWNLSNLKNATNIFYNCSSLTYLDVSNWNLENLQTMHQMFFGCSNLKNLNVSNWNVSSVKTMYRVFYGCWNLESLDLSKWQTSNVTDMNQMLWACSSLRFLDVSNWDTSNVTNMSGVFAYCENLEALDISRWNTDKVTDMSSTFGYLRKVKELDVSNWNTSNVTTIRAMFVECNALTSLNLDNFNTNLVTNMQSIFSGCHNLVTTLTIRGTTCTEYEASGGYWAMLENAATGTGSITLNYTADASDLVDKMLATKSETSNVIKGSVVA